MPALFSIPILPTSPSLTHQALVNPLALILDHPNLNSTNNQTKQYTNGKKSKLGNSLSKQQKMINDNYYAR